MEHMSVASAERTHAKGNFRVARDLHGMASRASSKPATSGFPNTRPQRNLTHKDAQQVSAQPQRPRDKIIWVGSQRIHTFASTAPFCLRIRSTNRLRPCYELCSARFLIALSMPEKIIA